MYKNPPRSCRVRTREFNNLPRSKAWGCQPMAMKSGVAPRRLCRRNRVEREDRGKKPCPFYSMGSVGWAQQLQPPTFLPFCISRLPQLSRQHGEKNRRGRAVIRRGGAHDPHHSCQRKGTSFFSIRISQWGPSGWWWGSRHMQNTTKWKGCVPLWSSKWDRPRTNWNGPSLMIFNKHAYHHVFLFPTVILLLCKPTKISYNWSSTLSQ